MERDTVVVVYPFAVQNIGSFVVPKTHLYN